MSLSVLIVTTERSLRSSCVAERCSKVLTLILYLNDDYSGGDTVFEDERLSFTNRPQQGAGLVFQHKLRHAGLPIESGRKVILRTDVMYRIP